MQEITTLRAEHTVKGADAKIVTFDIAFKPSKIKKPVVLFCHGFKGFKDWGAYNLMADFMADLGVVFIKMNFSHNGVVASDLSDITDLDLFASNTISKELADIGAVLDWITDKENEYADQMDSNQIFVIGHSRGGATALFQTISDNRISKLALWAPVADLSIYATDNDGQWAKDGRKYIKNARTGVDMPMDYGFVLDYKENESKIDTKRNIAKMDKPLLLVHGTADEAVNIATTKIMYEFVKHSIFVELDDANHTFGAFHPYTAASLPEDLEIAAEESVEFFMM
jgi:uncharacterized protein